MPKSSTGWWRMGWRAPVDRAESELNKKEWPWVPFFFHHKDVALRRRQAKRSDYISSVSAAPHCPAGHFSPYSDGEKGRCRGWFRQSPALQNRQRRCGQPSSPRHYTGRRCRQADEGQRRRSNVAQSAQRLEFGSASHEPHQRRRVHTRITWRSGSASRPASRHRHGRTAAAWPKGLPCS